MLYTQYFNNKYSLVGHLFQDRFRSEEIKSDGYHLYVSKYIHLNPVRAGIVASPVLYPWSSYPAYLGLKQDCLVTTQKILGYFRMAEVEQYQKYVEGEKEVQTSAGETRPRSERGDGFGLKR
ncbi:hypothetical protein CEB3_c43530 [Peptococcaceae bacterium CEB3]|nr:hypothetical protein CEB3_c43530 [Peptococcaceae bacterium CEB3]